MFCDESPTNLNKGGLNPMSSLRPKQAVVSLLHSLLSLLLGSVSGLSRPFRRPWAVGS